MPTSPVDFEAFWPEYVRAHANKHNRTLHVIGTSLALACIAAAVLKRRPWLLLLAPVCGYGFAWAGHFFVEKNKPLTLAHPILSLRADLLLWWKTICGEMNAEVRRVLDADARERNPVPAAVSVEMN